MTDHAEIVRDFIVKGGYRVARASDGNLSAFPMDEKPVLAALDALVAERDEWKTKHRLLRTDSRLLGGETHLTALARAEAAEAERDEARDFLPGIKAAWDAETRRKVEAYDAARAIVKTEGNSRAYYVMRAEAAEARVARLEEALREALPMAEDGYCPVDILRAALASGSEGPCDVCPEANVPCPDCGLIHYRRTPPPSLASGSYQTEGTADGVGR